MTACVRAAASAILLAAGLSGGVARAEIGARASIVSDEIFRGRSISQGRPAVGLDLAYDHPAGPYAGVAGKGVFTRDDGLQWLSAEEYAGFAWRLRPDLTLDLGVTNTDYALYSSLGRATGYSELTIGAIFRRASLRASLSPNWFGAGNYTGYFEANGAIGRATGWQVSLHGGLLAWLAGDRPAGVPKLRYDWRLGLGRGSGRLRVEAAWANGGPRADFYDGRDHGHNAFLLTASIGL